MKWFRENKFIIFWSFFFLLTSFLLLLFSSKSSPLYPFQDWVDANAFFTMGKSLFNGKILYKDLFEQKGPTLYLIYGIGYLISNKTFIGVFLIQVIFFSIFLFYMHKIITLFANKKISLLIIPVLGLLITTSIAYVHGGSAEEIIFPMLGYSLYSFLNFIKTKDISLENIFTNGLMSGIVLTIKYIDLGFWLAFIIIVFIYYIKTKDYKKAINYVIVFGLGFLIPLLIWLIYFALNNGLYDFIYSYFIVNIFSYAEASDISDKIITVFQIFTKTLIDNGIILTFLMIGYYGFIKDNIINNFDKFSMYFILFMLVIGVYIGGIGFKYYILIVLPFILFSLINIFKNKYIIKYISYRHFNLLYIILYFSIILLSLRMTKNINSMGMIKEKMIQYQFAEIINKEQNPTLLNYNSLDIGLYTTTGIVPNIKYFERQNFNYNKYPENMDEQNRYIKEKKVMFVVYRTVESLETINKRTPFLFDNYSLESKGLQYFEGITFNYYLFKVKK